MYYQATCNKSNLLFFSTNIRCCPYYTARNLKDGADILFMPYNYLLDKKVTFFSIFLLLFIINCLLLVA